MERLTADDAVMLWPDARWPQEIGALVILDGANLIDALGRLRLDAVRTAIESRLHLVPRFRQLLYVPRRGRGGPLWTDAPAFDLDQHVRVVPLPAPADDTTLLNAVELLRRERLDRARPLWLMCLFTGLPHDRVGLFVKMHHAIADGIAGIATIATFLDHTADAPAIPAPLWTPLWTPRPAPTDRQLWLDNLRHTGDRLGHGLRALAHPVTMARQARAASRAMRELLNSPSIRATSLDRMVGPDRTLAVIRGRLDVVAGVAQANHATINDILLTLISGGLRELLCRRGDSVDEVRVDVPITLRPTQGRARARGNRISQMIVPLPVDQSDPRRRLAMIASRTSTLKRNDHPAVGVMLNNRIVRRVLLKLLARNPVNVTSADLIGPPQPVYLAGARLLEVFPVLPLMGNVTLGVGALSYAGQFNIAVVADRDAYPDLAILVEGISEGLAALTAAPSISDHSQGGRVA